jgi:hypothetical protein
MMETKSECLSDVTRAARALLAMDVEMRRAATPAFVRLLEECLDRPRRERRRPLHRVLAAGFFPD